MAIRRGAMEVVRTGEQDGVLRLRVRGTIRQDPTNPQPDPMPEALGSAGYSAKVLMDLFDVDFLDSSGYNWLLQQNRSFRGAGGTLVLHSIPPLVSRILNTVRADLVFRMAADEAAAAKLAQEAGNV